MSTIETMPNEILIKNFQDLDILTLGQLRLTSKQFKVVVDDIINTRYAKKNNLSILEAGKVPVAVKIDFLTTYGPAFSPMPTVQNLLNSENRARAFAIFTAMATRYDNVSNYFSPNLIERDQNVDDIEQHINDNFVIVRNMDFSYLDSVVNKINQYVHNTDLIYKSLLIFFNNSDYNGNARYEKARIHCLNKIKDKSLLNDMSSNSVNMREILSGDPMFRKFFTFRTLDRYITLRVKLSQSAWEQYSTDPAYIEDFQHDLQAGFRGNLEKFKKYFITGEYTGNN